MIPTQKNMMILVEYYIYLVWVYLSRKVWISNWKTV